MTPIEQLLHGRYGRLPDGLPLADASAVIAQQLAHRSVRAFLATPLADGTLDLLMAAAQSAASSSNLQTWSVVAVQDAARKARMSEWTNGQAHVREAPLFLVFIADLSRLDRGAHRLGRQADANRYLEMFLVATIDAALAAQNAALAAESLGLGTVYIGALRNQPAKVAAELGLPARAFAVFGLCVGHPDPARPASVKPRLPSAAVLHHERYDVTAEPALVDAYDELIQAFQASQAMPVVPWSRQSAERVAGPQSLSGRHQLVGQIRDLGFGLD